MGKYIPDEIIDQIKAKSDIVDIVQSYIPLKRAGSSFKALCPFHNEKTPSFNVNPSKQMFYCFGCGKGGDVVKFVMEKENTDYVTALRILADRVGVIIPEKSSGSPTGVSKNRKDRLYKMHDELTAFFHENLISGKVPSVCEYASKRALDTETIKSFKIGASPDSWDECLKFLSMKNYTNEEMLESGVILRNSDSGNIYDRFRNRLMFPICDEQGRTVGFSGRTIDDNTKDAKYVNSPETPIFKKGRILYALDKAKENIRKKNFSVLCEGQLDVIAMHRGEINNAIAPQGTAFTTEQAAILKRYANKVFICFDGDEAGRNATLRAIEILLSLDMEPSVIIIPEGEDPDSMLRRGAVELLQKIVNKAIPFFDYLINVKFPPGKKFSPWEKNIAAADVAEYIAKIASPVLRASFSAILAERTDVPEKVIFQELKKKRSGILNSSNSSQIQTEPNIETEIAISPESRLRKAEEILLELCLMHGTYPRQIAEELPSEMISSSPVGRAIETAVAMTLNDEWENIRSELSAKIAEKDDPALCRILAMDGEYDNTNAKKAFDDCIKVIKHYHLSKKISALNEKILQEKDKNTQQNMLIELSSLKKEMIKLTNNKSK